MDPGERVAILSANRVEWHLADLGTLLNGSVTVPVYPTSSPAQIAYILGHADVTVCFVDTHAQLGKVLEVRDQLPALKRVVLADGARRADDTFVIGFDELRAVGADRLAAIPSPWTSGLAGAARGRGHESSTQAGLPVPPKGR